MNKKLIAVYGTLRLDQGNYQHLLKGQSTHLGTFTTEPEYTLYSLGGYPGLHTGGNTPIVMDVFEVDEKVGARIDQLEGYSEGRPATFYDRATISTPFGNAHVYIYMGNPGEKNKIEEGDWVEFKNKHYAGY